MNQKAKIWIFFFVLVFVVYCEVSVTVTATEHGNIQEISFKNPTEDTSKHIRVEYSLTHTTGLPSDTQTLALCGTHDEGDTLMTNNGHPGFYISHSCDSFEGCSATNGNTLTVAYQASKCQW